MDDWRRARDSWLQDPQPEHHREGALDARRRESALTRADAAYNKARLDERSARSAVVAFRQDWARAKVAQVLSEHDYVVTSCDDGADALGITAAIGPDVLLCEEPLASIATRDLVAHTTRLSARTRVVVQVQHADDIGAALDAGASAAASRATPLEELVRLALA